MNSKGRPMRVLEAIPTVASEALGRWIKLNKPEAERELFDQKAQDTADCYRNNIESYIGTVSIPVGLAGPLLINSPHGTNEYMVPLATTEATLVASYSRGAKLLTVAGGCNVHIVDEGINRTPVFAFRNVSDARTFSEFVQTQEIAFKKIVPDVTNHGQLVHVSNVIEGNHVFVDLVFSTGDAAGQNMVTFASEAICRYLIENSPVPANHWFLESNLSGDKKASTRSLTTVRGKRVVADATIPRQLIENALRTTPARMVEYWYAGAIGGVMSGTTGIQGHFANGLAALYLAAGQDIACVAESAVGITRLELTACGDLYACVTLPNIIVGTVGGGTGLPSARACRDILGLAGPGHCSQLGEVCGALVLAGELSIVGALCSGEFAQAHRTLARGEPT